MKIDEIRKELKKQERKLPYGSKQKIASSIGEDYDLVIAAFRGLAGESVSKAVLKKAYRINGVKPTPKPKQLSSIA